MSVYAAEDVDSERWLEVTLGIVPAVRQIARARCLFLSGLQTCYLAVIDGARRSVFHAVSSTRVAAPYGPVATCTQCNESVCRAHFAA